jgi:hypothetical protein
MNTKTTSKSNSTATELTAAQRSVLEHAIDHTEGRIEWFPDSVKGGGRTKVLESLKSRGLARQHGQGWKVTKAAHAALGRETAEGTEVPAPKARENSKQAKVIEMLKRPEGATIEQIQQATGWQRHTVRGVISGALRTKLGLKVECTKGEDGAPNVYQIV